MEKVRIKFILFDAANTLIHKPLLWERLNGVLHASGFNVDPVKLRYNHNLLSELITFPDRTSKDFYNSFNSDLLLSLGIVPSDLLLENIFTSCTYLPWQRFEDTSVLSELNVPMGVISNFNNGLKPLINEHFGDIFQQIIVSEEKNLRKPDIQFYQLAADVLPFDPSEILYIGDSMKLDMLPGKAMGWNVRLIDRNQHFASSDLAIPSLQNIKHLLQ